MTTTPAEGTSVGVVVHSERGSRHLLTATLTGAVIAAQSRVNGGLSQAIGSTSQAAFVCFAIALVLLSSFVLATPRARSGFRAVREGVRAGTLHLACLIAGLGGAGYVSGQTFSVPHIGVAMFTISAVAGQLVFSLIADRLGLGSVGRRNLTRRRFFAAGLAVVAMTWAVSDRIGGLGFSQVAIMAGFAAGAGIAIQMPLNGRVAVSAGSNLLSGWLNALVATAALCVLMFLGTLNSIEPLNWEWHPWYLYIGGFISATNVLLVTYAITRVGVLAFSVCQVLGLVVGAGVVDALSPIAGTGITLSMVSGCLVLFMAVVLLVTDRAS